MPKRHEKKAICSLNWQRTIEISRELYTCEAEQIVLYNEWQSGCQADHQNQLNFVFIIYSRYPVPTALKPPGQRSS